MNTTLPDLEVVYADAAAQLPTSPDLEKALNADEPYRGRIVFERGSLALPPAELTTSRLCILAGAGGYESLTVDQLFFNAHRETYRALGLFMMSALLAPGPNRFELALTHPGTHVRRLVIHTMYRQLMYGAAGLRTEAVAVEYVPAHRFHIPFHRIAAAHDPFLVHNTRTSEPPHESDLPLLLLTDEQETATREEQDSPVRDTVVGCGSDQGAYLLAELLLDLSQDWNKPLEYELTLPCGDGGVHPRSAELRLCLPGGRWWSAEGWDQPEVQASA